MAHYFESGFVVREQAWHGLAHVFENAPDIDEAVIAAGMDREIRLFPLVAHREEEGVGTVEYPMPDDFAVMRADGEGDWTPLATVGNKYVPLQDRDAFQWFAPLLHEGNAKLEAAGVLKGGRVTWVLARIGDDGEVTPGDPITPYLLLSNSHDGSRAIGVQFTPIRVVCWNTLSYAHELSKGKDIQIKHTAGARGTLAAVRDMLDLSHQTFSVSLEQYRAMRGRQMNAQGLDRYIREVFATDAVVEAAMRAQGDAALTVPRIDLEIPEPRALKHVVDLFETGPGVEAAGMTVFGAYQAITHYCDHVKGRNGDNSLHAAWFGNGQAIRNRAHEKALELC